MCKVDTCTSASSRCGIDETFDNAVFCSGAEIFLATLEVSVVTTAGGFFDGAAARDLVEALDAGSADPPTDATFAFDPDPLFDRVL